MVLGLGVLPGLQQATEAAWRAVRVPAVDAQAARVPAHSPLIGMVHGLAGSAALVLPASRAMPSAAAFFSIRAGSRRGARLQRGLNLVLAAFSMALGLRLLPTGRR